MGIFQSLLQRIGLDPADMAGAALAGEIPLSDAAINRVLARQLAGHPHVASARVTARGGDELLVRLEPRLRFAPGINVLVRIERQPQLPDAPTVQVRWHIQGAGPMTLLAGRALSFLNAAPPGIDIDGDLATIDLRVLLSSRGVDDLLGLVRRLGVHTRPGAVVVEMELAL